jgi:hypothetical protein
VFSLVFFCLFYILSDSKDLRAATIPLDEEAVITLYYLMDRKGLTEQDIEDYCFKSGKATFTSYKPSEMFMKHALKELLLILDDRVMDYDERTLFNWRLNGRLVTYDGGSSGILLYNNNMPQPTSYINSEISQNGSRSIKKMLDYLRSSDLDLNMNGELDIVFSMRPEKVEYRFQNRNIALEDVLLPIRYVIFSPVKMTVSDKERSLELNFF